MKSSIRSSRLALVSGIGLFLSGCLLSPVTVSVRRFVLSPVPPPEHVPAGTNGVAIGIGLVRMPPYLLRNSLAVRKGANEIQYMEDALWAEPLDQDFQRILAANLSRLLPTGQVYLSAGEPDQVKVRVFVNVERFDVDTQGRGVLTAWWRITQPGSDRLVKSGKANLVRPETSPSRDKPQAIVATLSALTGEFSRELAEAIRESGLSEAK